MSDLTEQASDTPIIDSCVKSADRYGDSDVVPVRVARELERETNQLRAEVDRLKEANRLGALYAIKEKDKLESDLQAARKALGIIKRSLDESVDRGINDNRMKHMLEILLTSEEYETVIAALNAELEKSK